MERIETSCPPHILGNFEEVLFGYEATRSELSLLCPKVSLPIEHPELVHVSNAQKANESHQKTLVTGISFALSELLLEVDAVEYIQKSQQRWQKASKRVGGTQRGLSDNRIRLKYHLLLFFLLVEVPSRWRHWLLILFFYRLRTDLDFLKVWIHARFTAELYLWLHVAHRKFTSVLTTVWSESIWGKWWRWGWWWALGFVIRSFLVYLGLFLVR